MARERSGSNEGDSRHSHYAGDLLKRSFEKFITDALGETDAVSLRVNETPNNLPGFDYGLNVAQLAKVLEIDPSQVPDMVIASYASVPGLVTGIEVDGQFVNITVDMQSFGSAVVAQILEMGVDYGKEDEGNGLRVIIDMSSPNVAKRMSYAHLLSTIIGDSLASLYRHEGYEVIRDNHLGDWGTMFGQLMVAIKRWGNESEMLNSDDPIGVLQELYVKFHAEEKEEKKSLIESAMKRIESAGTQSIDGLQEAIESVGEEIIERKRITEDELDMTKITADALDRVIVSGLEDEARNWFLRLEQGDSEARRLWELCLNLSIVEFNKMYELLGVGFEESMGESFYEDQLQGVVNEVQSSGIGNESQGALVVDMSDAGLGVAIVQKSDGASVYMTRDLACAIYRQEQMGADKLVYVVGSDQKFYFKQLFEILKRLGYQVGENSEHVYFGMVTLPEGKMSTREGRVILLKDVIKDGFALVRAEILQRNPDLEDDQETLDVLTRQIAIGALKWNVLSKDPKKPTVFKWEEALKLDGKSAPYVMYQALRARRIIEKSLDGSVYASYGSSESIFERPEERALLRKLAEFPEAIRAGLEFSSPDKIASYVYDLAKRFSDFYNDVPVLNEGNHEVRNSRLDLLQAYYQVVSNSLSILGIEIPERM